MKSSNRKASSAEPDPPDAPSAGIVTNEVRENDRLKFKWGEYDDKTFTKNLNSVYELIVYWKKNVFLIPTGNAGKLYIEEITRLMNAWVGMQLSIKRSNF